MIYVAKKSLSELRQLYFKMKDRVFSKGHFGMDYSTTELECILKEELGAYWKLSDVKFPKYV